MLDFPEQFNLADYYLFDRIEDGLAERSLSDSAPGTTITDMWRAKVLDDPALALSLGSELKNVYIVLPDIPPFAWTFFGALKAGAVITMGNPLSKQRTLRM